MFLEGKESMYIPELIVYDLQKIRKISNLKQLELLNLLRGFLTKLLFC